MTEETRRPRRSGCRGGHPGSAVPGARPRALLVGVGAAGARADEARPPPPPVPRQVHPTARRDAARAARPARRPCARSVRGLGHDTRAGARVGLRRDRRRHRGLQRAARAREDAALQSRRSDARPALGTRPGGRVRAQRNATRARHRTTSAPGIAPAAAEELLHFRSLVEQVGSADVLRVVLARSARSARRTPHFDLEFPRAPQLEPYWCSQAPARVQARRCGATVPAALHARHARPDRGLRRASSRGPDREDASRRCPRRSTSKGRTTASSRRRRIPA